MAKVLIVDDEPGMRRILSVNLRRDSHVAVEASGAVEAISLLGKEEFDVVVTDQKMPDGSGLDVLRAAQEDDPTISVIFLTAVGTLELAVESMRPGCVRFSHQALHSRRGQGFDSPGKRTHGTGPRKRGA